MTDPFRSSCAEKVFFVCLALLVALTLVASVAAEISGSHVSFL